MIKTKGFTLIELLATIVILGLLALIVTPGIAKVIRNSKMNTTKASMEGYIREVENAVALYMSDTGDIPDSIDDLELDGKNLNKVLNVTVVFDNDGTITKITATIDEFKCVYIENNTVTCQDKDIVPEIAFDESKCNTTLTSIAEVDVINNKLDICVNESVLNNGTNDITYTVNYNGMKARLPEASEIVNAVGINTWNEDSFYFDSKSRTGTVGYDKEVKTSIYDWLFNNLNIGSNATDASDNKTCLYYGCTKNLGKISGDEGYWTSTAASVDGVSTWSIHLYGRLGFSGTDDTRNGIRPVITLNFNN